MKAAFLSRLPPVPPVSRAAYEAQEPALREALGRAGRQYAEKYHSYEVAQYLFGAIYRKILDGETVDLMNLFHPLSSPFNRRLPRVEHPLEESRLPARYLA